MEREKARLYGFDNLRGVLIFLVVLGHFLEFCPAFPHRDLLRMCIYCFHMPMFIFHTGYFAKFRPKNIILRLGVTYVLFQTLYLLFIHYVLDEPLAVLYSIPYWILWYLFVTIVFYLLLPLVDVNGRWKKAVVFLLAIALALNAGYDSSLGYLLSTTRLAYFLPFFLLGFYCGKQKGVPLKDKNRGLRIAVGIAATVAVLLICNLLRVHKTWNIQMMYGTYNYYNGDYTVWDRALLMGFAFVGIAFFMTALLPLMDRKIPALTTLGSNSFSVFLLHGFIVKLCFYFWPGALNSLPLVLAAAAATVLACGNPGTAWVFNNYLTGQWIGRLLDKTKQKQKE